MKSKEKFKVGIVHLILSRKPEEALERLSRHYNVEVPKLMVGMPKGHVKNAACYIRDKRTICVSERENLYNPYLILHEFYHRLRTSVENTGEPRSTSTNLQENT